MPAPGSVAQGEVLNQVLPEVSSGALATIRGTVRVTVKLHVDAAGNISSAELFSPGPSKYFADQALQAAHRWDFAPAKVDGHAVPSDWLVRFEFTPSITKVHPTQSTP
jgi:TonB family protein